MPADRRDAPPVDLGQLRSEIAVQVDAEDPDVSDDYGNPVRAWTTVGTLRARVESLSGRDLAIARQIWPTVSYRITTHNTRPIRPVDRLVFEGRTLAILSALPVDQRPRWLVILATEFIDPQPPETT